LKEQSVEEWGSRSPQSRLSQILQMADFILSTTGDPQIPPSVSGRQTVGEEDNNQASSWPAMEVAQQVVMAAGVKHWTKLVARRDAE
jgi:hypothetical protein